MPDFLPILLAILGACLVYSEINRLFTRTIASVAENLADTFFGNCLKITFGFGLMYVGYILWIGSQPGKLLFEFEFPFFRPTDVGRDAFLIRCSWAAGIWTASCLLGTWLFWGVLFPAWMHRLFVWSIKGGLLIIAALTAREIYSHYGHNGVSLPFAVALWLAGCVEALSGVSLGFQAEATASSNSASIWHWQTSTWAWLRLGERTSLYLISVLLTFALAWLLGQPGWKVVSQ